jgi:hypothetical protein
LLGTGFITGDAHGLLDALEPRMREPNSIILAAAAVHAARLTCQPGETTEPAALNETTTVAPAGRADAADVPAGAGPHA